MVLLEIIQEPCRVYWPDDGKCSLKHVVKQIKNNTMLCAWYILLKSKS